MSGVLIRSPSYFFSVSAPRNPSKINQPRYSIEVGGDRRFMFSKHSLSMLREFPRFSFRCNSAGESGDNGSKTILEAFFLGRAVAEALNERAETAVGELLSTIGRFQAEQQKQLQEFQEEVLEKARRAKEQAAREANGAQRSIPRMPSTDVREVVNGGISTKAQSPTEAISLEGTTDESQPSDNEPGN